MSPNSLLEGPQKSSIFLPDPDGSGTLSGLISLITHTADMTSLTPEGGFFIVFTIVMSAGLSVLSAARAASNAGIASAKSPSHYMCVCVCVWVCVYTIVTSAGLSVLSAARAASNAGQPNHPHTTCVRACVCVCVCVCVCRCVCVWVGGWVGVGVVGD